MRANGIAWYRVHLEYDRSHMPFADNTRLKVLLALVLIAFYVVLSGLYMSNIPDILFALFLMQVAQLLKRP